MTNEKKCKLFANSGDRNDLHNAQIYEVSYINKYIYIICNGVTSNRDRQTLIMNPVQFISTDSFVPRHLSGRA